MHSRFLGQGRCLLAITQCTNCIKPRRGILSPATDRFILLWIVSDEQDEDSVSGSQLQVPPRCWMKKRRLLLEHDVNRVMRRRGQEEGCKGITVYVVPRNAFLKCRNALFHAVSDWAHQWCRLWYAYQGAKFGFTNPSEAGCQRLGVSNTIRDLVRHPVSSPTKKRLWWKRVPQTNGQSFDAKLDQSLICLSLSINVIINT